MAGGLSDGLRATFNTVLAAIHTPTASPVAPTPASPTMSPHPLKNVECGAGPLPFALYFWRVARTGRRSTALPFHQIRRAVEVEVE